MRSTAYTSARPRYDLADIVGLLFRQIGLMLLVFLVIAVLGTAAVMTLQKTYTAEARILAGVGQEYVYQPRVGLTERGQAPDGDLVVQSESTILNSNEVKQRVIQTLGPAAILGDRARGSRAAQETQAIKAMQDGLKIAVSPGSPIIAVGYESDDAARSATVLNAIIDSYLAYRRELFTDRSTDANLAQQHAFEDDLAQADAEYQAFLRSNDIGDFAAAKVGYATSYQTVYADRLSTQALLRQTDQRLQTLEAQLARTPPEVALSQDLNISAQDQILQARNERETLLARYLPDSQPVRDVDARIAQLEAYVASGGGVGVKEVRTGPNPIWTELETTRINVQAERDSLQARLAVLDRQLDQIKARQSQLVEVESQNATLSSEREVLSANIREFQQRASQSRADSALVQAGADNVTVIERATAPTTGKSLKLPLLALVILFAGFTALCVGLARIFSRRDFATAGVVGRTLDMPVLAVAPLKAR